MKPKPSIIWFRQDLRLEDNLALNAAIQRNTPLIPLYIYSSDEEEDWPLGGASKWWLHHSLKSLSEDLRQVGLNLIIRKGHARQVLEELIQSTQADALFWNRCYEPAAIKRDLLLKDHFLKMGLETKSYNASLLYEPWTVCNKQAKPFQVFTPFWKACLNMQEPPTPVTFNKEKTEKMFGLESLSLNNLDLLPKIHWDTGIQSAWKPGTTSAKQILFQFIKNDINHYKKNRDRPDLLGISRLSPHLHFGEISPRTVWHTIKQLCNSHEEGVECYLRQLGWREFAYHLLYHFPNTPNQPLRSDFEHFPWNESPLYLQAWQRGKTGYPFVDAGMRQLWTTGWMHNRLRMVVGSFLVKDLLIPWQRGAEWFWDTLVDADLANNTLGWQWVGGCGADAAPYFRIFNPITQGEKFDPNGIFVRQWVPELARLPNDWIHRPWEAPAKILNEAGIVLGNNYPKPIVDHSEARNKALAAFSSIKKD